MTVIPECFYRESIIEMLGLMDPRLRGDDNVWVALFLMHYSRVIQA